eukprot:Phypoly_transcript_12606.p1 GENE.Phypoly_transcript_12606~~Phypoly_transcript_12606.p1  ORF type:complete len:320 (+),score=44.93 Phypoly_transcript_12606:84-1043(+)
MRATGVVLLFLGLVLCCKLAHSLPGYGDVEAEFKEFMFKFNKNYASEEYNFRFQMFKENLEYIESFNVNNKHMQLGINSMSDMSYAEYLELLQKPKGPAPPNKPDLPAAPSLPTSVDWRNQSDVGPVLDMRPCGGPSFAVAGSVQSFCAISSGSFAYYNPTQVTQCMHNACNSSEDAVFDYIAQQGLHNVWTNCNVGANIAGCCIASHLCFTGTEVFLETGVAMMGPIVVAIDASQPSFKGYQSGIYFEPECSTTNLTLNLLVVGYGVDSSNHQYWIAQNYWGTSWGMNGYILMARNQNNNCGIASHQCHPVGVHQCTK